MVISVPGVADGYRYKPFVVVGGFGAPGLNINNNNFDNRNVAVAALRKFYDISH